MELDVLLKNFLDTQGEKCYILGAKKGILTRTILADKKNKIENNGKYRWNECSFILSYSNDLEKVINSGAVMLIKEMERDIVSFESFNFNGMPLYIKILCNEERKLY